MVIAELVEAAEGQVEHRPVERPLLDPELVEEAFEVMGQPIDGRQSPSPPTPP